MSKTYCLRLDSLEADPMATFQVQVREAREALIASSRWLGSERGKGRKAMKVWWQATYHHWGWLASNPMGKLGNSKKHTFPGHPTREARGWGICPQTPVSHWLRAAPWRDEFLGISGPALLVIFGQVTNPSLLGKGQHYPTTSPRETAD